MQLLEELKEGKLFGYVQCDIEIPEILRANFANFPPIFNNTLVSNMGNWWKTMPKNKDYCLNLEKCWHPASHYKTELWLLHCACSICNWGLLLPKYTLLLGTLQRNVSTVLCSQQWTQEWKVMKIQIQVSLGDNEVSSQQFLRLPDHTETLQQSTSLTRKHMGSIIVNCSKN